MNTSKFEESLSVAQERLREILDRGKLKNSGVSLQDSMAAFEAVASAQRALAAARDEEYAQPYDLGFEPEAAVSEAVLLQTEYAAVLTFSAVRPMPDGSRHEAGHAIVEIVSCSLTKFGYPNDEALAGHPLYEKGLSSYGVFEVINSSWTKLKTEQNRVAFPYTLDSTQRHFIFTFHDSTFECIARGLRATLSTDPYKLVIENAVRRLFPGE